MSIVIVRFRMADSNPIRAQRTLQNALEQFLVHDPTARDVTDTPEILGVESEDPGSVIRYNPTTPGSMAQLLRRLGWGRDA